MSVLDSTSPDVKVNKASISNYSTITGPDHNKQKTEFHIRNKWSNVYMLFSASN